MEITPLPGFVSDMPFAEPRPKAVSGYNVRWRSLSNNRFCCETIGLATLIRDSAGVPINVQDQDYLSFPPRDMIVFATHTGAQPIVHIFIGSVNDLVDVTPIPTSDQFSGVIWQKVDRCGTLLEGLELVDIVYKPPLGSVQIVNGWSFAWDGTFLVAQRRDANESPWKWKAGDTLISSLTNAPKRAVDICIHNRVLIAFGAESFAPASVDRWNCIRWSDRLDYDAWTPSDINLSGETYVDEGSRIMAGCQSPFGPICWTDRVLYQMTPSADIDVVFAVNKIDGSRGILANKAHCESDGQVWWLDEHKELNVYDGGRPRQIQNPIKYITLERMQTSEIPRIWMEANPEFGEIMIGYLFSPAGDTAIPDRQLVYNYLLDAWYIWALPRSAWHRRTGVLNPVAIDDDGNVVLQEMDTSLPADHILGPAFQPEEPYGIPPSADACLPFSFSLESGLLIPQEPGQDSLETWRLTMPTLCSPAAGAENDKFTVRITGYENATLRSRKYADEVHWNQNQSYADYRVGGKALGFSIFAENIKTVVRFGYMDISMRQAGER